MSDTEYIAIGNFGTDYDPLTSTFLDASTDLSFQEFFQIIYPLADALNLRVEEFFERWVALTGDRADLEYIKGRLGKKFSYALIDESALEMSRDAEYGPCNQDEEAVEFGNNFASNQIKIQRLIQQAPKFRLDA